MGTGALVAAALDGVQAAKPFNRKGIEFLEVTAWRPCLVWKRRQERRRKSLSFFDGGISRVVYLCDGCVELITIAYMDLATPLAAEVIARFASPGDRAATERYRRPERARQSLGARVLLRAVLAEHYGFEQTQWRILSDARGAPRLQSKEGLHPPAISFSHSGLLVACAIAPKGRVGIDIEQRRQDRRHVDVARAAFGPREIEAVIREGESAFYRIWTLREAVAKATGEGFCAVVNGLDLSVGECWSLGYWELSAGHGLGVALAAAERLLPGDVPQPAERLLARFL